MYGFMANGDCDWRAILRATQPGRGGLVVTDAHTMRQALKASADALRKLVAVVVRTPECRVLGRVWYHTLAASGGLSYAFAG